MENVARNSEVKIEEGDVYVLTNDCLKEVDAAPPYSGRGKVAPVKIGQAKNFKSRLGNLNSAVYENFRVHYVLRMKSYKDFEDLVHDLFDYCRISTKSLGNKTEFFACPLSEVHRRIDKRIKKIPNVKVVFPWCEQGRILGRAASSMKKAKSTPVKYVTNLVRAGIHESVSAIAEINTRKNGFGVRLKDGKIIRERNSADTFVKIIQMMDVKRVFGALPKLVNKDRKVFPSSARLRELKSGWLINVHGSTKELTRIVKKLGDMLNMGFQVFE